MSMHVFLLGHVQRGDISLPLEVTPKIFAQLEEREIRKRRLPSLS
jgi:hypothetical protein